MNLWNNGIVTERRRSQQCKCSSASLSHTYRLKTWHSGGERSCSAGLEHAANHKRSLIHAGVGWNHMTNLAVAVAVWQWLGQDSMWQRNYLQKQKPRNKFFKLDINTDLVLISSRNLNTTWVTKKQLDHSLLLNCNQGHIALGDRFWLFIQTLNNDKKPFNSIFNSQTKLNYSFIQT